MEGKVENMGSRIAIYAERWESRISIVAFPQFLRVFFYFDEETGIISLCA